MCTLRQVIKSLTDIRHRLFLLPLHLHGIFIHQVRDIAHTSTGAPTLPAVDHLHVLAMYDVAPRLFAPQTSNMPFALHDRACVSCVRQCVQIARSRAAVTAAAQRTNTYLL